jgi:large repetitive protein
MLLTPFAMHAQVCQFTASEITGPTNACAYSGSNGQIAIYSVEATNASAFTWQLPDQANLLSGQGTNTIQVKFKNDFTEGAISVQIANACGGDGASRTIQVGEMPPAAPLSMTGPNVVCDLVDSGMPAIYTISAVPGATRYQWNVPANTTLISGQGTTSIIVLFSSQFQAGTMMVRSGSACGPSANLKYSVNVIGPKRPGPISGQTHGICADNNIIEYNIEPVRNATSYSWTTSVPGAVVDNQGPKAIITFPFFSKGSVTVQALGACPVSGRSINIYSSGQVPDSIRGPKLVCAGSVQNFSVDVVEGATHYDWTVPEGSIINSGDGSPSINVTIGQVGGMVTVRASSECDAGAPVSKELQVEQCEPPTCPVSVFPNPTSGLFNVNFCATLDGVYNLYVTDVITGQILYHINGNYQAGENVIGADISNLGDGYYVLYLVTEEIVHHENLVLDHNSQ